MNKNFKIGLLLTSASWITSWGKFFPPLYKYSFFPLWLGYILTINGLSEYLLGNSLMKKMQKNFHILFLISIPFWWIFEFFNRSLSDWRYVIPSRVGRLEYLLRGSIDFSTVIPAILSTVFLFYFSLSKIKAIKGKPLKINGKILGITATLGIIFTYLVIYLPKYAFPLTWLGIFLIIDPINYQLGFPSILGKLRGKNINFIVSLCFSGIFTGFWWELWNFYASPKWVYNVPFVEVYKIFEMPILGYLGYPFFALEIYAYTNLTLGLVKRIFPKLKLDTNLFSFVQTS